MIPARTPPLARALACLVLSGVLTGCGLLPQHEPVRLFALPDPSLSTSHDARRDLTLRVDTPSAGAPLSGSRLLVMPTPGEYQAYAGARWRDTAPRLVRDQLIAAYRQDGRLAAVVDEASRARNDVTLASQLGGFHSRHRDGTPEVVVRLEVQLIDETSRKVVVSRRFETVVASNDESLEAAVEAFGRATDQLTRDLVDWTLANLPERP